MNSALRQTAHISKLDTPFGDDVLVIQEFSGQEGLGEMFEYRIDALSENKDLDFDQALGKKCQVTHHAYEKKRIFNGYLVEAEWLGMKENLYAYRLILRPWLWLLSRKADCRIFENQTALDIIQDVFNEHGYEFRKTTVESYPKLEYCVQYRESDLDFVLRLMEQHGIYYFFEHEDGKHTLVLADGKSSHTAISECATLPFLSHGAANQEAKQHVADWSKRRHLRTGKIEFRDYNFEKPNADMTAKAEGPGGYAKSDMQIYDYPGKYKEPGQPEGEKYAKVWLESEQAVDQRRFASGDAPNLFPGGLVALSKLPAEGENIEYLLVRTQHNIIDQSYRSRSGGGSGQVYSGSYEFQPSSRVFRMPYATPEPRIHGIQTAKVVADDDHQGEEIAVDKHGRVRVEFHWVRPDPKTGKKKPSRWIRCAQAWSGKGWGGQFIPRVGMEVVVEFLEGDPDQPLIVGTVYNGDNKHPYDPDEDDQNKTQSGFKSNTTKGGRGYNEFRFEDRDGNEEIFMRAQKFHKTVVRRKETTEIGEEAGEQVTREVKLISGDDQLNVEKGGRTVATMMEHKTSSKMQIAEEVIASKVTLTPASIEFNTASMTETAATKAMTIGVVTLTGNLTLTGTLTITGGLVVNGKPLG